MATFRDLPPEIRCMIWRYYLLNPRVIALEVVREKWQYRKVLCGERSWLHHVNREARQEALRVQKIYDPNVGKEPQFYVNFDLDVVWLINHPQNAYAIGNWRNGPRISHIRYTLPTLQNPLQNSLSPPRISRLAVAWGWWQKASVARYPGPVYASVMEGFRDNASLSSSWWSTATCLQHAFPVETPSLSILLHICTTWNELGIEAKRMMDDKRMQYVNIMNLCRSVPGANLEALETRWSEEGIIGIEDWKVPEVRWVEAVQI